MAELAHVLGKKRREEKKKEDYLRVQGRTFSVVNRDEKLPVIFTKVLLCTRRLANKSISFSTQ